MFVLCVIALVTCCDSGSENTEQINGNSSLKFPIKIDVESLIHSEFEEIRLSSVVDSIEYVPLETTDSSLIGLIQQVVIADSFIFICTGEKILEFNREGKYLHQIGSTGRGPGQFIGVRNISIDDAREILFINPNFSLNLIKYTYTDIYLGDQPTFSSDLASSISYIRNNRFSAVGAWTYPEWISKGMFLAALLDSSGQVIKKIDTPLKQFDNYLTRKDIQYPGTFRPTYFDSITICLGYGCDTVFALTQDTVEPRYILNTARYDAPLDIKYGFDYNTGERILISEKKFNYIFFESTPIESAEYLIFKFYLKGYMYLAAFNKFIGATAVYRKKGDVKYGVVVNVENFGLLNDLDGGLNFYPRWTNLNGNIWVDVFDAIEFKTRLAEQMQSFNENYPEEQNSLRQIADTLQENDNPVLMIAYVK